MEKFTEEMDPEAFFADNRTSHAVIRWLLIVGDAMKRPPEDVHQRTPRVEWRKIAGMRDWLAHVEFSINPRILCDAVASDSTACHPLHAMSELMHLPRWSHQHTSIERSISENVVSPFLVVGKRLVSQDCRFSAEESASDWST